mgnify:CR=1 FL=1
MWTNKNTIKIIELIYILTMSFFNNFIFLIKEISRDIYIYIYIYIVV